MNSNTDENESYEAYTAKMDAWERKDKIKENIIKTIVYIALGLLTLFLFAIGEEKNHYTALWIFLIGLGYYDLRKRINTAIWLIKSRTNWLEKRLSR